MRYISPGSARGDVVKLQASRFVIRELAAAALPLVINSHHHTPAEAMSATARACCCLA